MLGSAADFIAEHAECNLHWTPNGVAARIDKKPAKTDIASMRWVHLDLDDPSEPALARLRAYRLPPTLIVFSGGGYQAFWRLREVALVNGNAAALEAANRAVIADLSGDTGTWNLDRVMRLPGTMNWPDEKKRARGREPITAHVIEWHPERTYVLADFVTEPQQPPRDTSRSAT